MPQQNDNNTPPQSTTPGQEIDTGSGGFSIDGKRFSYDIGSDAGDGSPQQWSPGQVNVDKAPSDLSKGTKRTLASYLSRTTMGQTPSSPSSVKNSYPVDHNPFSDPQPVVLKDTNGYPTIPGGNPNPQKYVQETLLSSRSDAAVNLKILRGKQQPTAEQKVDGHTLLKDATPPVEGRPTNPSAVGGELPTIKGTTIDPQSPINNYYGSSKLSNSVIFNRFNPEGNKYEESGGFGSLQFSSKYEMGSSAGDRDMSHARLAQIGNALSIRAGLELTSTQDGNNPTDNATTAATLLPGAAQLGVMKIDRDILTARDVFNSGIEEGIDTDLLINPAGKSWGTLNNVLDQYAGVSNFGMQLLAVALVAALGVAISLFMKLFSLGGTSRFEIFDPKTQVRPYGASLYDPKKSPGGGVSEIMKLINGDVSVWGMLGIEPTSSPFEACLSNGALQFFGIDSSSPITNALDLTTTIATKGAEPASQNPGFYAVMARAFNRSFLVLSDYFSSLAGAFGAGAVAGTQQLFSIIDALRASKFIKFLNIFAQLGNKKLKSPRIVDNVKGFGQKFQSDIDTADDKKPGKGRINKTEGLLPLVRAHSAFKAPDLLLVPQELRGAAGMPSIETSISPDHSFGKTPDFKKSKLLNGNYLTVSDGRISSDDREAMERYLDSEYMPFYLHDVRTNEIVSFHAFLVSLSDDYSASYDSVEAFGRVEPIKTYKGTTRKISFSFILAAFSEKDFDAMWAKINKITTMVYPQFTEGRKLVSPDGKYSISAPFSQSIQAAPLIRVRIGDLIRSNYSKFALSRLFGLYYNDSKLNDKPTSGDIPSLTYDEALQLAKVVDNTFFLTAGTKLGSVFAISEVNTGNNSSNTDPNLELPPGYVVKIVKIDADADGSCICIVEEGTGDNPSPSAEVMFEVYDEANPSKNIVGKTYKIPSSALIPSPATKKIIEANIKKSDPTDARPKYDEEVKNFMNDREGNAISRSFRSVGGKGLPGFIESLSFDWYDKVTWETEKENGKAPKMCKINISFSPFHDIAPGLDHRGFNRAPVYPVGPLAPKE